MRFLRGNTGSGAAEPEPAVERTLDPEDVSHRARNVGKGRPTPSRRETQGRRRGPAPPPPRTQREALRRMRGSKAQRRERMLAGDQSYLLPRDQGPVKAYVRDLVDSRRHLAGAFMPLALLVIVVVLVPSPFVQQYASLVSVVMLLAIIVEGVLLGRTVKHRVRERFPNASESGTSLGFYAMTRATQLRRLRVPKPRIGRGDPIP
ncbi:MAG: DUF3043 domain-containing protein [Pseudonocardiales bacterium]|nr:DUF3043 domain-containing protein [Pseudonocardiales bacterium]MBV9028823.1 DUF3043 domain-containing protein [Pseudonocardiales bacterium]MBW0010982.1 DUF3043 domain-containing protein [Pseudonocardiales bacterium]